MQMIEYSVLQMEIICDYCQFGSWCSNDLGLSPSVLRYKELGQREKGDFLLCTQGSVGVGNTPEEFELFHSPEPPCLSQI